MNEYDIPFCQVSLEPLGRTDSETESRVNAEYINIV